MKYALCNESPDVTAEDLRRPALMRWSIEQCFKECKDYLGLDHYESRSWIGWRRHMLLCFIAHLFIIKLRMEYSCKPPSPGVAPHIDEPVSLDDYLDATEDMLNNRNINHPYISTMPSQQQQIMTIGLVRKLINYTFIKSGLILEELNYQLKNAKDAFDSHTKNQLKPFLPEYFEPTLDFL